MPISTPKVSLAKDTTALLQSKFAPAAGKTLFGITSALLRKSDILACNRDRQTAAQVIKSLRTEFVLSSMLGRDHKFEKQINILSSPESTSAEITNSQYLAKYVLSL